MQEKGFQNYLQHTWNTEIVMGKVILSEDLLSKIYIIINLTNLLKFVSGL